MKPFILSILGVLLLIGIGMLTMGQQYAMIPILITLFSVLYINHKRTKERSTK